uniref:MHC class I-like antigen recognition-like domain-containing protein n=1 Tax=Bos indicus x Bos taurus TaxID=30522 RepID=A0A4W2HRG3_BOBOX
HSSIPLSLLLFPIFPKAASSVVPPSPGSHSLCYNITVLSQDGSVQSRFFAEGYLDRQAFLHYDHKKGRAEPWGQWAEKLAAETLETEYTDLNATWKELRKLLEKILSLQEEKGDDSGEGARVLWAIFLEGRCQAAEEALCALSSLREQGLAEGLTGSVLSPHRAPSRECDLQKGLRGHGLPHIALVSGRRTHEPGRPGVWGCPA